MHNQCKIAGSTIRSKPTCALRKELFVLCPLTLLGIQSSLESKPKPRTGKTRFQGAHDSVRHVCCLVDLVVTPVPKVQQAHRAEQRSDWQICLAVADVDPVHLAYLA